MNKQQIIQAILSKDIGTLRRIAGKLNGKPVLAYIDGDRLATYDKEGKPIIIDWSGHSIEDMQRFMTDYNIVLFDNYTKLRQFIERGEPIPRHSYNGIPPWLWTVLKNDYISFDG